ncbi:MAG TPA: hypothetical protein VIM65_08100 [Cyclobacteriaceae bacterium]
MRYLLFFFACFNVANSCAQVVNNDINQLQKLNLDSTAKHSTTKQSTVQWSCVSKALTEKCLVYHNDQWFTFQLTKSGTYYLNFSNQLCRDDNHGLQVLLIEGSPCLTSTYKIKKCLAKIHQNDLFIKLDSLKQGIDYLLNVDGFLGDYCEFDIQLATEPDGFPLEMHSMNIQSVITQKEHVVNLKWTVDESLSDVMNEFEVWRKEKSDKKYKRIAGVPLNRNTYGSIMKNYEYTDTLKKSGEYTYQIMGIDYDGKYNYNLAQKTIHFRGEINKSAEAVIHLNYSIGTPLQIIVFDPVLGVVLKDSTFTLESKMHQKLTLSFSEYISVSQRRIDIVEQNMRTKKRIVHHYSVSSNGEVIPLH